MEEYHELNQTIRKSARKDYRNWVEELATQAQNAIEVGNVRSTYQIARKITHRKINVNRPIQSTDGTLLTTDEQQLLRWTEHFNNVLNVAQNNIEDLNLTMPNVGRLKYKEDPPTKQGIPGSNRKFKESQNSRLREPQSNTFSQLSKKPGTPNEFLKHGKKDFW